MLTVTRATELRKTKKTKNILRAAAPVWMSLSLYETGHSQLQFVNFIKQQHKGTSHSNPVLNSKDTNRKMMAYDETVWCETHVKERRAGKKDVAAQVCI